MPLLEAVTIEVGAAIAKAILKLWVKDSTLGDDISSSLIDLFKGKTADVLAQRRGERQFERIGDKVGESLLPLFEREGARLDEGERCAVAYAVAETFNTARLSSELLAEHNLQPTALATYMLDTHPNATRDLSAAAEALYMRVVSESCVYVTDIASQLPSFTERTFAEVLRREDQLIKNTEKALDALQRISEQLDPMISAERFEIDYRRAVVYNLDELNLIGVDVSPANRRHRLSVAYITLSVEVEQPALRKNIALWEVGEDEEWEDEEAEGVRDVISVDEALSTNSRMLIRGEPGSGKTTLLRWIAVGAAKKSFEGVLAHWNNLIPFYIRLRECVHTSLPRPEAFPGFSAPAIADTMPKGWVHQVLRSGRALVLVDGLDEIPAFQRENVRVWLGDLINSYRDARYIITSRPHAVEEGWMSEIDYADTELQPMGLTNMDVFIEHWHKAVREELQVEQERAELESLAQHLKDHVKNTRPIRMLAKNPLLCAMLCALNRERRRQLPVNRIELYKACCSLLLDRRDKDRQVDLSDYPPLSYAQKLRLLEDLAYDMMRAGLSEREMSDVDEGFTRKLANMPGLAPDTDGQRVRKFFVERTGMIREPIAGQIDFTHRTFQEFFAAQAALDAHDIQTLLDHAHDDQWRELTILAAGLANQSLCEQLIEGIMERGDQEVDYRYQLHLLAVACLETAIELKPTLRAEVEKRLSKLVPPKNITDAKALAAAGELAIKHLAWKNLPDQTIAACFHTLVLIGGDAALSMLTTYANETRVRVELIRAWESFDREEYAKQVLSQMLRHTKSFSLEKESSLDGIQYLTQMTTLKLNECNQISDLTPLASLTQLTTLKLNGCNQISDLTPLASLTQLTTLNLAGCSQISDLTPLASLTQLTTLKLNGCNQISDLRPLTTLRMLNTLYLAGTHIVIPKSIKERVRIIR